MPKHFGVISVFKQKEVTTEVGEFFFWICELVKKIGEVGEAWTNTILSFSFNDTVKFPLEHMW